ncbi:MAG: imidazoleglycerol-phosphate dehydratase HisB [Candidatus Onthomonas sp.]|nr:imidazoleglycerol-phosphate dehydratase HisB [Candidatus Onthomonas sp.]
MARTASITRNTKETQVSIAVDLDGEGVQVSTGIGFFDHMLTAFGFYAKIGLKVNVHGDLEVDGHHTVEDTGIVLGQALKEALGDRTGIRRFGSCYVPMDEALAFTALDFSNRPYLVFDAGMPQERIGDYDSCLTVEFMRALAVNAGITLHQKCFYGANAHHMTEGLFKSLGMAIRDAVRVDGDGVTSTKGVL